MESLRVVDHLVLPVHSLSEARSRLTALGFIVAGDARHPFGTENACVFLADGTYLEPLAVYDGKMCEAAVRAENMFVARDRAFRFRFGEEGLSAVVLKTDDARVDEARFRSAGYGGGPMLSFSRPVRQPDGSDNLASFHLAFAADMRSPDFFFFACQRVNAAGFPAAPAHPNGVAGLKAIVLSEEAPNDFREMLALMTGDNDLRSDRFGLQAQAGNLSVSVLTSEGLQARFAIASRNDERGLLGEGLVFTVASLDKVAKCLVDSGVEFIRHAGMIIVPPSRGQGTFHAFEEQP